MTHSTLALAHALNPATLIASVSASELAGIALFFVVFFLVIVGVIVLLIISRWKIFEKAGVSGWKSLIHIYGQVKLLEITNLPLWWIVLIFLPFVNIVVAIILARRLAGVFGKGVGFTWGLVLLPFVFYPILAFGGPMYSNTYPTARPMSEAVKWSIVGLFLLIAIECFSLLFSVDVKSSVSNAPAQLTQLQSGFGYATDGNYVYYEDQIVPGADPATFKVEGDFGIDDTSVYYGAQVLPGADPATFKILPRGGGAYASSDKNVWNDDQVIFGADPATFTLLDSTGSYAEDVNTVYYSGTPISGVDRATFTLVTDPSGNENYDAKDKDNYYLYGDRVTKAGKYLTKAY